jgi:hypothetical protein
LPNNEIKLGHCLEQEQGVHIAGTSDNCWKSGIRVDLINVCTEGSKFPWVYVEKGPIQNTPLSVPGSQEDEKQNAYQSFAKGEQSLNGVVHKAKLFSCDLHCIPINRNNFKHSVYSKNEVHDAESEGKGNTKSEASIEGAVNCTQCDGFVVGNQEVGMCTASNSRQQLRNLCTAHMKNETVASFQGQSSVRMGDEVQGDVYHCKGRCSSHFVTCDGEITEQTKMLIKDVSSEMREMSMPEILDQAERRREKGKLRMRLKRHSETEEEAERRRERGRLRMRVLRASETEEQAARRRELNRLRMRMKRHSARH